jgi:hypothetical protein
MLRRLRCSPRQWTSANGDANDDGKIDFEEFEGRFCKLMAMFRR